MHFSPALVLALAAAVSAHGVVTEIKGANGVTMPGLTLQDGTPRDCSSNGCGSQADTAIIRDREIASGKTGPLGRTQGNGNVDAAVMVGAFMGQGAAPPANQGASGSVGVEDNIQQPGQKRQFLGGLLGGGGGGNSAGATGITGLLGGGGEKVNGPPESRVAAAVGAGAASGMPTCADDGTVTMTLRQVNQDGAGPFTADVDGTSGGTDEAAMQSAEVTQDVPGLGVQGISLATNTEFDMKVQMPAGMTCDATVAGVNNVCVMRVRNGAAAGPFGGSVAFTQGAAARKRAIAYRLKKRMEIGGRKN
ncbi:cell surface protein [Stemphylium lycopersici]|uniref:Cell surface protein n=1 Tax=Stemphylium lycopersici TaxID=183478 RepID=A0A364N1I6_STELY|nr:cell surface protein [Stemphylium lycopersici]RAR02693.1 cell surface protein [Stemphylium lycopersici]RAR08872.1 cell surface protein [Stemphylium lycopersici]